MKPLRIRRGRSDSFKFWFSTVCFYQPRQRFLSGTGDGGCRKRKKASVESWKAIYAIYWVSLFKLFMSAAAPTDGGTPLRKRSCNSIYHVSHYGGHFIEPREDGRELSLKPTLIYTVFAVSKSFPSGQFSSFSFFFVNTI